MRYKGLIFDFDYTLGDSTEGIVASVNYALEKLGYAAAEREAVRKTIGLHLEETYRVLVPEEKEAEASEFALLFRKKADQVMTEQTQFFPGVLSLLEKWKSQGMKLAIVTTKYHYRIDAILKKYQANHLIDVIVGGEDVRQPKPDPQGIFQVLYMGDSVVDAKTAQAAGVDFAGVTTGATVKADLEAYPNVGVFAGLEELKI